MATDAQVSYIERLLIDCGFTSREQRNAWLKAELGRDIKYIDDLRIHEASRVIDRLREMKDDRWETEASNRGYDAKDDYRK